jgi:hypothetical protein
VKFELPQFRAGPKLETVEVARDSGFPRLSNGTKISGFGPANLELWPFECCLSLTWGELWGPLAPQGHLGWRSLYERHKTTRRAEHFSGTLLSSSFYPRGCRGGIPQILALKRKYFRAGPKSFQIGSGALIVLHETYPMNPRSALDVGSTWHGVCLKLGKSVDHGETETQIVIR